MAHRSAGEATLVAALLALLAVAIAYPLLQVLSVAFLDGGTPTLRPLLAFFARPLFREAFVNTLLAGGLAVVIGSVIAVPLALLTVRYRFPGRALVPVLGVLPLVIPPFVGAVAFQQILGRRGAVNLLLLEHAGWCWCRASTTSRSSCSTPRPRSPGSTARSRRRPRTSAARGCGSSAACCCRWPCRGTWRARCSRSSG